MQLYYNDPHIIITQISDTCYPPISTVYRNLISAVDFCSLAILAAPTSTAGTWPPATINYTTSFPPDLTMLGLRDVVVLTPSPSSLHHRQQQQYVTANPSNLGVGVGVGIFPFLAATPVEDCGDATNTGGNFWRTVRRNPEPSFAKKDAAAVEEVEVEEKSGGGGSAGSLRACEDCGNRAKRDCSFRRCRTCCKSRGYDCSTHLKSTWVPAAVRRERQVTVAIGGGCSTGSSSGANKRPRVAVSSQNATSASHTSTSNNGGATTRSFPNSSYHQDASFKESLPGQVSAPAVFRCIRVTAINEEEAEFGYQATVTISGHVFKGFLYDQGLDHKNAFPSMADLRNGTSSSSPIVDPSSAAFARGLLPKGDN